MIIVKEERVSVEVSIVVFVFRKCFVGKGPRDLLLGGVNLSSGQGRRISVGGVGGPYRHRTPTPNRPQNLNPNLRLGRGMILHRNPFNKLGRVGLKHQLPHIVDGVSQ